MDSPVYTEEQLNYFRVCYIATEILPQGLRTIFKQEWDNRHKTTLGEWQDTPKNGFDFFNGESKANQKRNARLLATMKNGDRNEWDCTMLFYAILNSDSIPGLDPLIRSIVADLREFRNENFAHMPEGQLSDRFFEAAVLEVETSFQALGLSTAQIQTVGKQNSFPTDELQSVMANVKKIVEELHKANAKLHSSEEQRQVLEQQLQREVESFCILPPKPPHQIAVRDREVATIENELQKLRDTNTKRLSYFYISGNPGSGKSQLAGLVATRVYDRSIEHSSSPSFVMTLNSENLETLLESYVSLARKVSCPEYTVANIHSSKDKAIEEKITNLKDLIGTKLPFYEFWLLVVDNVTNLSRAQSFLPELGNEQLGNGQLLITTQDSSCIPPDGPLCCHISISQGIKPSDASCFLATIAGIKDHAAVANEVTKALDYQPLALASAATYVTQVRKLSPSFGWSDYLVKLEQGKRALTEKVLAKANPSYPKSMTAATKMAVERELKSDEVMKHVFTFLAFCASQPLSLHILINYLLSMDEDQDKEDIALQIQGSSLFLIEKEKDSIYIRLHQVVHDMVKLVVNDSVNSNEHVRSVHAAVISFNQFIDETIPRRWNELDSVAETKQFAGHLKALSLEIGHIFAAEEKYNIFSHCITDVSLCSFHLRRLGRITQCNGDFSSAKEYCSAAVKVIEGTETPEDGVELAHGCIGLGKISSNLGFHHEGKKHLERALSIYLTKLGPDHVEVARIYSHLGKVERRLGNLQQAKEHFESSLLILRKLNLQRDTDAAYTCRHLGSVQWDLGDHQEAEENLQRALSIYLEKFDARHVDVGRTFHYLGLQQYALANLHQAREYLQRALSVLLEKLGIEHVEVARVYRRLGAVDYDMGKNQQAKEHYKLALSIFKKRLSPDHDDVVQTIRNLRLCDDSLAMNFP